MKPIETVAEAERRAKRRLPKAIFDSLVAGTEKRITTQANVEAFDQIGFRPRPVAVRPSSATSKRTRSSLGREPLLLREWAKLHANELLERRSIGPDLSIAGTIDKLIIYHPHGLHVAHT